MAGLPVPDDGKKNFDDVFSRFDTNHERVRRQTDGRTELRLQQLRAAIKCVVSVCIVSQSWQVGHVHSHCEYSLEVADGIDADVDLYIGLKSINITLQGPRVSSACSVVAPF